MKAADDTAGFLTCVSICRVFIYRMSIALLALGTQTSLVWLSHGCQYISC